MGSTSPAEDQRHDRRIGGLQSSAGASQSRTIGQA
jgi:hypothetical protein